MSESDDDATISSVLAVAPDRNGHQIAKKLYNAIDRNDLMGVRRVLHRHEADPNEMALGPFRSVRQTPLFLACRKSCSGVVDTKIVETLLSLGADPTVSCLENGFTPLHLVTSESNPVLIQLLARHHHHTTPSGSVAVVARDMNGDTPLHVAALRASLCSVEELLASGAISTMATRNTNGQTPLDLVVSYAPITRDRDLIIQLLLEVWAKKIVEKDGEDCLQSLFQTSKVIKGSTVVDTPIGTLKTVHFQALLKTLVSMCPGCVGAKDDSNSIGPLMQACGLGFSESVVYFLLRQYPDVCR